jgi:hypothetical protein
LNGYTTWGGVCWGWDAYWDAGGVGQAGQWEPVIDSWEVVDPFEWSRFGGGMMVEEWLMAGNFPVELLTAIQRDAAAIVPEPDFDDVDLRRCGFD